MPKLSIRIDLSTDAAVGPGKIRLLELIDETGSISAAGRQMGMAYRRAWLLVDELNGLFKQPVATAQSGGGHGGGAQLTPFGRSLVQAYRAMERKAHMALSAELSALGTKVSARRRRKAAASTAT
jgi:molybdate transport system regulatory protein